METKQRCMCTTAQGTRCLHRGIRGVCGIHENKLFHNLETLLADTLSPHAPLTGHLRETWRTHLAMDGGKVASREFYAHKCVRLWRETLLMCKASVKVPDDVELTEETALMYNAAAATHICKVYRTRVLPERLRVMGPDISKDVSRAWHAFEAGLLRGCGQPAEGVEVALEPWEALQGCGGWRMAALRICCATAAMAGAMVVGRRLK